MSPIGRIFSVLNLALAVWFLAWAVQTAAKNDEFQNKYSAEQTAHSKTRTDLEDQVRRIRAELQTAEGNAAASRDQFEQERNKASRLEGELGTARTQLNEATATAQRLSQTLDGLQGQLAAQTQEASRAVEGRVAAERARDAALGEAQRAQSSLADAQSQIRALNGTIAQNLETANDLQRKIGDLETDLETLVAVTGVSRSSITSQPQIEATVIQANYDITPGLVAINVGSDKGVQRGHTFEVYNGPTYKGQVRVENVHATMSTALVVRPVEGATIRQGDRATTRL